MIKKMIKKTTIILIFILLILGIVTADISLSDEKIKKCVGETDDRGNIISEYCYEESVNINLFNKQKLYEWYNKAKDKIISQQEEIDMLRTEGQKLKGEVEEIKTFICNNYPQQTFC